MNEIEPELVTAHLNVGMWSYPCVKLDLNYPLERFNEYILPNILSLIQSDWIAANIQDILTSEKFTTVKERLLDIFICVPSTLIELSRPKEAEEVIKTAGKLLKKTRHDLPVIGILNLMLASISIYS